MALLAAAGAAASDDAALRQEVDALKEIVRDLQTRVAQLEGRDAAVAQAAPDAASNTAEAALQAAPAVVPEAAPIVPQAAPVVAQTAAVPAHAAPLVGASSYVSKEAALNANWSRVVKGMDQNEITRLLGPPSKQTTLDGRTVWYYYYPGTGSGSVFFTDVGRVSSRQSPFGLGW